MSLQNRGSELGLPSRGGTISTHGPTSVPNVTSDRVTTATIPLAPGQSSASYPLPIQSSPIPLATGQSSVSYPLPIQSSQPYATIPPTIHINAPYPVLRSHVLAYRPGRWAAQEPDSSTRQIHTITRTTVLPNDDYELLYELMHENQYQYYGPHQTVGEHVVYDSAVVFCETARIEGWRYGIVGRCAARLLGNDTSPDDLEIMLEPLIMNTRARMLRDLCRRQGMCPIEFISTTRLGITFLGQSMLLPLTIDSPGVSSGSLTIASVTILAPRYLIEETLLSLDDHDWWWVPAEHMKVFLKRMLASNERFTGPKAQSLLARLKRYLDYQKVIYSEQWYCFELFIQELEMWRSIGFKDLVPQYMIQRSVSDWYGTRLRGIGIKSEYSILSSFRPSSLNEIIYNSGDIIEAELTRLEDAQVAVGLDILPDIPLHNCSDRRIFTGNSCHLKFY